MPWKAITAVGGAVHGSSYSTPEIAPIAAMRPSSLHASSEESWAPFDMPSEKTFDVSMHNIDSR